MRSGGLRSKWPALLCGLLLGSCAMPDTTMPKNLLVVTLDTVRADHFSVYGYPRPTTEFLASWAREATVFEDVLCSMPTTLPSHLSLFSGQPPRVHGARRNGVALDQPLDSIFRQLGERGLRTAAVVAARVLDGDFISPLGLDEVFYDRPSPEVYQVPGSVVHERTVSWLDANGQQPFGLWVHYYDAHEPYDPPTDLLERFAEPSEPNLPSSAGVELLSGLEDPDPLLRQRIVDLYDAELAEVDRWVERLFAELGRRGLLDDTLVVIAGDHGQALGDRGYYGHGFRLLESTIRVPLMIRLPGQVRGRRVGTAVELLDVYPTLLDAFGIDPPESLPGRSLLPSLEGLRQPDASARWVERREYPDALDSLGVALHLGEEKWTYYFEDEEERLLRGLRAWPGGLDEGRTGESETPAARAVRAMAQAMAAEREAVDLPPETEKMLRALGYL